MTIHRCMRTTEQFYTEGCSIMIVGDDDARLHYRDDYNCLRNLDRSEYGPAEVRYVTRRAASVMASAEE